MARAVYAARRLDGIEGVRAPVFQAPHFQEFVVNFDAAGRTVKEINRGLLESGIFGGHDLRQEFPELGQSALYCFTEVHGQADIDRLVGTLQEVVG
jgi:glycine dehydrogenase subunit 1